MDSNTGVPSNHQSEAETSALSDPTANEPRNEGITDVQTMNSSIQEEPRDVDNNAESVMADFSALSIAGPSTQNPVSKTNVQPTSSNSSSGPPPTDKSKPNQTSINNVNNESHKDVYLLKPVYVAHYATLMRQSLKIILQNEFGPCGLIAICNLLILKNEIHIPQHLETVNFEYLVGLIGDYILKRFKKEMDDPRTPTAAVSPPRDASSSTEGSTEQSTSLPPLSPTSLENKLNFRHNLEDALKIIPNMGRGLDVNVKFDSIFSFELTPELVLFDLLGIKLVHGWTVDPQDELTYDVVVKKCGNYNKVIEKVIEGGGQNGELKPLANETEQERERREKINFEATVASEFLNSTSSQLTYYGLHTLSTSLSPDLYILFRNNHFSVLYQKPSFPGEPNPESSGLYTLVTDVGYRYQTEVVWESLRDVEGDSWFVDGEFAKVEPSIGGGYGNQVDVAAVDLGGVNETGVADPDADLALAIALQEEENIKEAARRRHEEEQRQNQIQVSESGPRSRSSGGAAAATEYLAGSNHGGSSSGVRNGNGPQERKKSKSDCTVM